MDQIPQVGQPEQDIQKLWDSKTIISVLFIVILLVGVFAVNYFNIVPLYKTVPGFWRLPRILVKPTPVPRNNPAREAELWDFLQKNIKPAFLGNAQYFNNSFVTQRNWNIKQGNSSVTLDAILLVSNLSNDVKYIRVAAYPMLPVDKDKLSSTLMTYFNISLPPTLPCFNDPATNSTYCQQLTRIGTTRQIIGAQFGFNGKTSSPQTDYLYLCELYPGIVDNQQVSCVNVH